MATESAAVGLARASLKYFLETGTVLPVPASLEEELQGRAGTFVSLKKQGQLRGCIGTFKPTRINIASEIIYNAISAGTEDPRFWPLELEELEQITISVDVLEDPELIDSLEKLDPEKYGVIVKHGRRSGLLLPMLEGVDTVAEQVDIAREKAGISAQEEIELYRFSVTRYT
jgi:AmmeMemoRadiSam system protein A